MHVETHREFSGALKGMFGSLRSPKEVSMNSGAFLGILERLSERDGFSNDFKNASGNFKCPMGNKGV